MTEPSQKLYNTVRWVRLASFLLWNWPGRQVMKTFLWRIMEEGDHCVRLFNSMSFLFSQIISRNRVVEECETAVCNIHFFFNQLLDKHKNIKANVSCLCLMIYNSRRCWNYCQKCFVFFFFSERFISRQVKWCFLYEFIQIHISIWIESYFYVNLFILINKIYLLKTWVLNGSDCTTFFCCCWI